MVLLEGGWAAEETRTMMKQTPDYLAEQAIIEMSRMMRETEYDLAALDAFEAEEEAE